MYPNVTRMYKIVFCYICNKKTIYGDSRLEKCGWFSPLFVTRLGIYGFHTQNCHYKTIFDNWREDSTDYAIYLWKYFHFISWWHCIETIYSLMHTQTSIFVYLYMYIHLAFHIVKNRFVWFRYQIDKPFTYNCYEKCITIGFKSGTMNFSLLDTLTECGKNFIYVSYILYEVILINTREWRIIEQIEKYTWHAWNWK